MDLATDRSRAVNEPAGTYRTSDSSPVSMDDAKQVWAVEARNELERVARNYNAVVNYGELAEAITASSGIRTKMLTHYWIGDVLTRVGATCHERGEPLLSSLCVHQDGTIGEGYATAIAETFGGDRPDDVELRAAEDRLACYRFFGAPMPRDGGKPTLTSQVAARRRLAARREWDERPRPICPSCGIQMPASKVCDYCV